MKLSPILVFSFSLICAASASASSIKVSNIGVWPFTPYETCWITNQNAGKSDVKPGQTVTLKGKTVSGQRYPVECDKDGDHPSPMKVNPKAPALLFIIPTPTSSTS